MKPVVIVIAGGSASGKSTVVSEILERFGADNITVISHDDYYNDNSDLSMEERIKINYDHPNSLDNRLFCKQVEQLISGESIDKPVYNFKIHNRENFTEKVSPKKIIILEGILVLQDKNIRDLADIKIFVKCDDDIRFIRRLKRDMEERQRSLDSVVNQYLSTVKPMYHEFVSPSARYADIIIPNERKHDVALEFIVSRIKDILNTNE